MHRKVIPLLLISLLITLPAFSANKAESSTQDQLKPQPYGESIAGPERVDTDAQIAMRKSADNEITLKRQAANRPKQKKEWWKFFVFKWFGRGGFFAYEDQ